jgi:hypothetical protein
MIRSTPVSFFHLSTPGSALEHSGPLPSIPLFKPLIGAARFELLGRPSPRDHRSQGDSVGM